MKSAITIEKKDIIFRIVAWRFSKKISKMKKPLKKPNKLDRQETK